MKWNLAHASPGADLGGVGSKLPKPKRGSSEPARLPQEVLDWEASEKGPATVPACSETAPAETTIKKERGCTDGSDTLLGFFASLPDAPMPDETTEVCGIVGVFPKKGYQLGFNSRDGWTLVIAEMNVCIELPKDNYVIYTMNERDILLGENLCKKPCYCEDLLNAAFKKDPKLLSGRGGHSTPLSVHARVPIQ